MALLSGALAASLFALVGERRRSSRPRDQAPDGAMGIARGEVGDMIRVETEAVKGLQRANGHS
jgi:hypothetical protein